MILKTYALILFLTAAPLAALADTLKIDDITSQGFTDDINRWMLNDEVRALSGLGKDPDALNAVAQLFRDQHPRASVALQNYFGRHPNDPAAFDLAGVELLRQQSYKKAAISFRRAVELGATGSWTNARLGTAHMLSGDFDRGEQILKNVIAQDGSNPLARRYLAWAEMRHGNLPRAIQHSEAALDAFGLPRDSVNRAHLDLAQLYHMAQRHIDVKQLLERAVHNSDLELPDPVRTELYGMYLDAALQLRDVNGARIALTRLRRMGLGETPQYRLSAARLDLIEDKPAAAVAKLEALRADEPDLELELIPDLARAEALSGDVGKALDRLKSLAAVRGLGRDLPVWQEAAALVAATGTDAMTLDLADELLATPEDRADLKVLGIELLIRAEEIAAAESAATELVAKAPEIPAAHVTLGTIRMKLGKTSDAEHSFRTALDLRPEDPEVWLMLLGAVHGHETYGHETGGNGHEEVFELLNDAIASNPDSAKLHTELGLLHLSDADLQPAIAAFDAALDRSPGYLPALSLGALARADSGTSLDEARELAGLAREIAPGDAIARDIEGWIAFKDGDIDRARQVLDEALELSASDTTTLYHRAAVAEHDGDTDLARELFLRSLAGGDTYRHYREDARAGLKRVGPKDALSVDLSRIGPEGAGETLGTISISRMEGGGVVFAADISGLPEGLNAAHVHENPTCAPKDGSVGGAAGPHFGHSHVHMMAADGALETKAEEDAGMMDHAAMGHGDMGQSTASERNELDATASLPIGDLKPFVFNADGQSTSVIEAEQLSLDDIRGRTLMIHHGPDTDGKSGPKIACAIIH